MKIKKMYQSQLPAGSVLNTSSNSQTSAYSCNYVNLAKTVVLDGEWRIGFKPSGSKLFTEIPIFNPTGQQPTVSITSAEVYGGSSWALCTASVRAYNTTGLILELDNSATLTNGNVYLVKISGTITCS